MLEVGRRLDLGQEPLGAHHGGQLGAEDLERDRMVMPDVVRQADRGHPALTDLTLDAVAALEG